MTLVDAHVHLDGYGEGWPAALAEIRRLGIVTVAVSMDVASFGFAERAAREEPLLLPSFGIHPWNAPEWAGRLDELEALVQRAPMLGEVGLDRRFVKDAAAYGPQETVFEYFLGAAGRTGKLLNLHTSGAEARVAELVEQHPVGPVIVHWYNGPMRPLARLIEAGAYFSVGVEVLNSDRIARVARRVPPEQLLSETDNPGGWKWLRGTVGNPGLLEEVVGRLAELRRVDREEMEQLLESNSRRALAAGGVAWPGSRRVGLEPDVT